MTARSAYFELWGGESDDRGTTVFETRQPLTTLAALGTVALGCCLGLSGPQMTDLIFADPKPAFATVLAVTVTVLAVVLVRGRRPGGIAQPA